MPDDVNAWLTKPEAARFLNVAEKTIDRLAARKEVGKASRKRPGLPPLVVFRPEDLQRIKAEREAREANKPPVRVEACGQLCPWPAPFEVQIGPPVKQTYDDCLMICQRLGLTTAKQVDYLLSAAKWLDVEDREKAIARAKALQAEGVQTKSLITKQQICPDAFIGVAKIPCNPAVRAHIEALCKAGKNADVLGWTPNAKGSPNYLYTSSDEKNKILIKSSLEDGSPAEKWQQVKSIGALTLDVFLSVLVQLLHQADDEPTTVINSGTILRNKGIKRRGKERRRLEQAIDVQMQTLASLRFDAACVVPYKNDGTRQWQIQRWPDDQLFDIVRWEYWQPSLIGETADLVAVQWRVRFGQWRRFWLSEDTFWIAHCARTLLELDHREQRGADVMAKKIGIYLTSLPNAWRGAPRDLLVKTVLDRIGEKPENPDKNWPGRTRDLFEAALQILITARFLAWEPVGDYDQEREKGWAARWLEYKIRFRMLILPIKQIEN